MNVVQMQATPQTYFVLPVFFITLVTEHVSAIKIGGVRLYVQRWRCVAMGKEVV